VLDTDHTCVAVGTPCLDGAHAARPCGTCRYSVRCLIACLGFSYSARVCKSARPTRIPRRGEYQAVAESLNLRSGSLLAWAPANMRGTVSRLFHPVCGVRPEAGRACAQSTLLAGGVRICANASSSHALTIAAPRYRVQSSTMAVEHPVAKPESSPPRPDGPVRNSAISGNESGHWFSPIGTVLRAAPQLT